MKIIGLTGLARSGKDLFYKISNKILTKHKYETSKYAFADTLKEQVAPFLKNSCDVDVWTNDSALKSDIRDFLVWYGSTFWRKRDPNKWVDLVDRKIKEDEKYFNMSGHLSTQHITFVSDVRYPNEAKWIHDNGGYIIHINNFTKTSIDGGKTWTRIYKTPPNQDEIKNDPLMIAASDYQVSWEDLSNNGTIKINEIDLINNIYLEEQVYNCLLQCPNLLPPIKL